MDWLIALGAVLGFAVLLYLPGLIACWAAGLRAFGLLAMAPAVTVAIAGIGGVLAGLAHVRWSLWTMAAATVIAVAIAALLGWRWPIIAPRRLPAWTRRQWAGVGAVALGSMAVILIPALVGMTRPGAVLQKWDGVFHLNLVEYIRETGNGSMLTAGAVSNTVSSAYYPAAWHDVVALLPHGIPTVIAVNAATAVSAIVVWVVSVVYLARVVFPAQPAYAMISAVLAALYRASAVSLWSHDAHLPNALGAALLPALLAWTVQLARVIKIRSIGRGTRIAVLAVAVLGASLAHPNTLFSYLVLAIPVFGFIVVTVVRRLWSSRRQWLAVVGLAGLALVIGVGAYAILSRPEVQSVIAFDQAPRTSTLGAVFIGLIDTTTAWTFGPNVAVAVLIVVGLVVTIRGKVRRWLVISYGIALFLFVSAAGDWPFLRIFTGLWYSDVPRLAALLPVAGIPLCAIGAMWLWRHARPFLVRSAGAARAALSGRQRWVAAACALAIAAGALDGAFLLVVRYRDFALAYPSKVDVRRPLFLDPAEQQMIARLPDELDRDGLVLGDPFNGSAFLYSLASQPVVFTHVAGTWDEDRIYLAEHFDQVGTDPQVCRIVNKLGVRYYYADPERYGDVMDYPALDYGVPVDRMRMVDTTGKTTIYEITACR